MLLEKSETCLAKQCFSEECEIKFQCVDAWTNYAGFVDI